MYTLHENESLPFSFPRRLDFSLVVLMLLHRTEPTRSSHQLLQLMLLKAKRKENHFEIYLYICVCVYVQCGKIIIIIIIFIFLFFVLVRVVIFVIHIIFKWKQQTRQEGQILNDEFPYIYRYQFRLSQKVHAYSQSIVFLLFILESYFILTYILR